MTEAQDREGQRAVLTGQLEDLCREMRECADQMEADEELAGNEDLPAWLETLRDPERAREICLQRRPAVLMRMPTRAHELFERYMKLRGDLFNAGIEPLIKTEA